VTLIDGAVDDFMTATSLRGLAGLDSVYVYVLSAPAFFVFLAGEMLF